MPISLRGHPHWGEEAPENKARVGGEREKKGKSSISSTGKRTATLKKNGIP